ncbi:macrophage mannose receptor 1-like isoform X2 [Toxotes jaculatrix]|nr:macrophage mannose receptor 1-like isoform X2 [Toxotes jaculatrix]
MTTDSDISRMYLHQFRAWIGLKKSGSDSWLWPDGQSDLFSYTWESNEPNSGEDCASIFNTRNNKIYGARCERYFFFICSKSDGNYHYEFIPLTKTWSEAQDYCRNNKSDLAVLKYLSDPHFSGNSFPIWVGLYRDGETWSWSSGFSEYRNWKSGGQSNNGDCVTILSTNKEMVARPCSDRFPFICYRDNLVLINDSKTWYEALDHCRALGLELVSVQPGPDHKYMMAKIMAANTEEVWTGLHFLGGDWLWINGADMLYSDLPVCPINGQHCGVLTKNNTKSIETRRCSEKRNFLCYK